MIAGRQAKGPFVLRFGGDEHRHLQEPTARSSSPGTPLSLEDARRIIGRYVAHYNTVRLHSSIGYVTPADKLARREQAIFAERDRKQEEARQKRQALRQKARRVLPTAMQEA